MTELDQSDRVTDEAQRREGALWREARHACPHPDLLLTRRADALEPAVRQALADHLAACDACARLSADLDALALHEPDRETASRVRERMLARRRRPAPYWIAWAAGIVLAAGTGAAWWWTRAPNAQPAPANASVPAPAPSARPPDAPAVAALWTVTPPPVRIPMTAMGRTRSGAREAAPDTALLEALEGYRAGRFADSIAPLENLTRRYPESSDVAFYLGVCHLLSDRAADAVPVLERTHAAADATRAAEIEWYLAAAEQRTGRTDHALRRLRALCRGTSTYRPAACDAERLLR